MNSNNTLLVRKLLHVHRDLVCAQERVGVNPLNYATQKGKLLLLVEFLRICLKSIEDVTSQNETALHIALKNDMFDAFELLVAWLRRAWFKNARFWEEGVLNWLDFDGNTVLHNAASKNQLQAFFSLYMFSTQRSKIEAYLEIFRVAVNV
jgi:ankyrin repeat protein